MEDASTVQTSKGYELEGILYKLVFAVLVGGSVGIEREFRVGLGLRTMMLVCLGSAMFTILSGTYPEAYGDPRRISAAVVSGIGFLGAGMILRHEGAIIGLTTAATVWLVAALGMAIGLGQYFMAGSATVLVVTVLWTIPFLQKLTNARKTFTYHTISSVDHRKFDELDRMLREHKLSVTRNMVSREADQMKCIWQAYGKPSDHAELMRALMADTEVSEFHVT